MPTGISYVLVRTSTPHLIRTWNFSSFMSSELAPLREKRVTREDTSALGTSTLGSSILINHERTQGRSLLRFVRPRCRTTNYLIDELERDLRRVTYYIVPRTRATD